MTILSLTEPMIARRAPRHNDEHADQLHGRWLRLGDAIEALARKCGLAPRSVELSAPPADLERDDQPIGHGSRRPLAGWKSRPNQSRRVYADFKQLLAGAGPILLRLPGDGGSTFLAIVGRTGARFRFWRLISRSTTCGPSRSARHYARSRSADGGGSRSNVEERRRSSLASGAGARRDSTPAPWYGPNSRMLALRPAPSAGFWLHACRIPSAAYRAHFYGYVCDPVCPLADLPVDYRSRGARRPPRARSCCWPGR